MRCTTVALRRFWTACCLLTAGVLLGPPVLSAATAPLGPTALAVAKDGTRLFVAHADAKQLALVDPAAGKVLHVTDLPAEPTAAVLSPDGTKLYVTCAAAKSTVCVIEASTGKRLGSIPAGHTATGAALTPDGKRLYVCNRFDNDVTVIDLGTGKELARVKVVREPLAAVATPDGRSVFVINHLPLERADAPDVAAVVTAIDTAGNQAQSIRLPNGSTGLRGLCLAPDGRYLYVVHILSRYQMPAVQLDRGWMNTNALTIIDVQAKRPLNTVLLDDVDLGAANPWGVAVSADGQTLCVSHAGTHELSVIDASGLLAKLARIAAAAGPAGAEPGAKPLPAGSDVSAAPAPADVPNDLAFLVGLRRRIHLEGSGPRGLALIGSRAYVAEYFSDSLGVVELEPKAVKPASQVALGPRPEPTLRRRGEMLFNDAEICFQHWQSCASCHPDGRVDGLNWDLTNDGLGNPKNTRSLVWVHQGGAAMALGVRPSAEAAVRAALTHILFAVRPEEEARALDAYLKSLGPVAGPHLVDGHLSPAGQRGMQLFSSPRVACDGCHPPPIYSDKRAHDVGSAGKLDKPTDRFRSPRLVEVWRTAPYLHDGHWLSVKELLTVGKHGLSQEQLGKLSERDIDDLVEFVLSL